MILGVVPMWLFFACLASIMWGIGFVLSEQLLKNGISSITIMTLFVSIMSPIYFVLFSTQSNLIVQFDTLLNNKILIFYLFLGAITIISGNLLILQSISEKNASLASLIEITYPLFVIFFSWFLFKDIQINWGQALGGVFIFLGIAILVWKS